MTEPNWAHGHLRLRRRRRADRHDRPGRPADDLFLQRRRRPDRRDLGRRLAVRDQVTYTYDADNELTGAADSYATLTFTYDNGRPPDRPTRPPGPGTGQPTVTLTYSYDQLGDETSVTDSLSSQGITTYAYDADQRMTSITTSYGGTAGPQVVDQLRLRRPDHVGRRGTIGEQPAPQVNTTLQLRRGQPRRRPSRTGYVHGVSGGTTTPLATYVYSYDNANRVTTRDRRRGDGHASPTTMPTS